MVRYFGISFWTFDENWRAKSSSWGLTHQIDLDGHSGFPGSFEEQKTHAIASRVSCHFPITRMLKVNAIFVINLWRLDRGNLLASGVR